MVLNGTKEPVPFDENVSSKWIRNESIPVDYRNKNLELQFTSVLTYFKAYIKARANFASMRFTSADVRYLKSVSCILSSFSELCSLLSKAQNSKPALFADEKKRKGMWRAYNA